MRLALFACVALGLTLGCGTTGTRVGDEARRALLVIACKTQCPIAATVAIDACDGNADGQVTPLAGTLYTVCIQEAELLRVGCSALCDLIPLPSDTPAAEEPNASDATS